MNQSNEYAPTLTERMSTALEMVDSRGIVCWVRSDDGETLILDGRWDAAALESALAAEFSPQPVWEDPSFDQERTRLEQSNDVASIVFDQVKKAWPEIHPVLDLRYGIADALWDAGYRKAGETGDNQ